MADTLEIVVDRSHPGAVVVRASGRVDGRSAPQLLQKAGAAHERGRSLVLNLAGVTFLSSAGVGVLMVLAERLRAEGGLRLAPVSETVRTVLALLNLDQFLTIDASESDAIAGAQG